MQLFKDLKLRWTLWRFVRQLDQRERYILHIMQTTPWKGMWGLGYKNFMLAPDAAVFRRMIDGLADQHFDGPLTVEDCVGKELAAQLVAHRYLKHHEAELFADDEKVVFAVEDLRNVPVERHFVLKAGDKHVYVVISNTAGQVMYRRWDQPTYPPRTYNKRQGPNKVFLVNPKIYLHGTAEQ